MFKEEVLTIVRDWTVEQLDAYILKLENRIKDAHELIRDLKSLRKKRLGKKPLDNGPRDGR
jgi:hypothetical protein